MSIERPAHPVFIGVWATLVAAALAVGVTGHGVAATAVLAAIALAEVVAVLLRTRFRVTLSELSTLYARALSKHRRPLIGWNTLLAIQALVLWRLVYVVGTYWGGPPLYVAVIGGLLAWGQEAHWRDPVQHG